MGKHGLTDLTFPSLLQKKKKKKKKKCAHIYSGLLLSLKKNEVKPFAETWMDLQIITLNEVS